MLVGGALIEGGTYLFEIDKYSYWNGTFIINLFFSMIFVEFLIYPIKSKDKKVSVVFNRRIFDCLIVCMFLVLYGTFLKTGIPLLNGIHRSIYFGSIVPDYVNLVKGRMSFVCFALGYYYFNYRSKRYLFYFFLIVLYHILCSIKGGELLIVIYSFIIPITLFYTAKDNLLYSKKLNKRIRSSLILLIIAVFSIIFINYKTVENYDAKTTALEKIQKRVEAAGQIWWTINDNDQVPEKVRWDLFLKNFSDDGDKFERGMNQLMNVVAPPKYINAWRSDASRGQSLANGFPAIGYYYFGYPGIVLLILIVGCIIVLIKKDILLTFESGDVLSFLFLGPLFEVIIRVTAQGDINLLFEKRTLVIVIAYMLYGVLKRLIFRAKYI